MYRYALTIGLACAASAALALPAVAHTTDDCEGPGGLIPPTGTGGSDPLTNTFQSSITIDYHGEVIDLSMTLHELVHSWVGDLRATLTHIDTGTSVDLFSRIGQLGGSGFGDSSNFNGTYQFHDAFSGNLWSVASTLNTSGIIPSGMYYPVTTDGGLSSLSDFAGEDAFGTWTLSITDFQTSDAGSLECWALSLVTHDVPAPGAIALLGLAGLSASRRRRSV